MHGTPHRPGKHPPRAEALPDAGALLAGLVIDQSGAPMMPTRRTASGALGSRYYLSDPSATGGAAQRIPAARLDRSVVGVLKRVGLLPSEWCAEDVASVLRRVVVYPDALEILLNSRPCLALWRTRQPGLGRATIAKVLATMKAALAPDEELSEVGATLRLSTPRYSRNRCVRDRGPRRAGMSEGEAVNAD